MRFVLPPSVGSREARERAEGLDTHLSQALGLPVELSVAADYLQLAAALRRGECDAAWAPPFVCARIETAGLKVLVRGMRDGRSTYRAALVCRAGADLTLETLGGATASWVDPDSVGGYLLVAALFKAKGLDFWKTFREQRFAGSYLEGLKAVVKGEAHVTSVFAAPGKPTAGIATTGVAEIAPKLLSKLAVVTFTEESPNDGIAASSSADPRTVVALCNALLKMNETPEGLALLRRAFRLDGFEPAPADGYRVLYHAAIASF